MAIDKKELVEKLSGMRDILNKMVNKLDDENDEIWDNVTNEIEGGYESIETAIGFLSVMMLAEKAQEDGEYED